MTKKINPGTHYDNLDEVLRYLEDKKRPRHLLLGNGFSIAYDKTIFSYKSLSNFAKQNGSDSIRRLFEITKTSNFEEAINSLSMCSEIIKAFDCKECCKEILNKLSDLRDIAKKNLIDSIANLHPEHVFKLSEFQIEKCGDFLKPFLSSKYSCSVISTNYDLLLYWVLMRYKKENLAIVDNFSYELNSFDRCCDFQKQEHSLIWALGNKQTIFYLHGALHLFSSDMGVVKEQYREEADNKLLLSRIEDRINNREYPLFITEGDGNEKLKQISRNAYLSNCLSHLRSIEGSLVTFGFSFGDSDNHIIDAINMAANKGNGKGLLSIYIGIFSDSDRNHIKNIQDKFNVKVNTFDATSVDVWGKQLNEYKS